MARLALLGSKRIAVRLAAQLSRTVLPAHRFCGIISLDDSLDTRSARAAPEAVATSEGVAFYLAARGGEIGDALERLRPDIAIVAGWYHMIDPRRYIGVRLQ